MASVTPKTVVILGEGFAGIRLAKELSRLTTNDRTLDIDLVNQENCFAFQPMLPVKISFSINLNFPTESMVRFHVIS